MTDLRAVDKYIQQRLVDVDERVKNKIKSDIIQRANSNPKVLGSLKTLKESFGIYTSLLHVVLAHLAGDPQYKMPYLDPLHNMTLTIALIAQEYMGGDLNTDFKSVGRARQIACKFLSDTWKAYYPIEECVRKFMPHYDMTGMTVQQFLEASDPDNLDVLAFVESTKFDRLFYIADDNLKYASEYHFPCKIKDKKFYEVLTRVLERCLVPTELSTYVDIVKWMLVYNGYSCKMWAYLPTECEPHAILKAPVLRILEPQYNRESN